jgi:aminodeoxychorismate synthase component I
VSAFTPAFETAVAIVELPPPSSMWQLAECLWERPHPWLLESTLAAPPLGRWSFAGADPYLVLRCRREEAHLDVRRAVRPDLPIGSRTTHAPPLDALRACLPPTPRTLPSQAPPFCGGAVGVFGYELGGAFESLPPPHTEGLDLPDLAFLFVDSVLAFDHLDRRLFACGLGFAASPTESRVRADEAARTLAELVARPLGTPPAAATAVGGRSPSLAELERLASELPLDRFFDASAYEKTVDLILDEIVAGNVYQACLTQRLDVRHTGGALALYRHLRALSPAPFAACLELPGATLISSSPERFLRVGEDRTVESRPIKGTRPRGDTPAEDQRLRDALARSEKERAENLMIVDLVRNDLGRVCDIGSVHVPQLMAIEPYATLFQMVSTIRGRLRPDLDALDAVAASFPPGSMTGAPKIAAMKLLSRLEPCRRGYYAGALGYLDVRGGLDLSVVIRTILLRDGRAHVHAGGGIVADSDPAAEYAESLDKARVLLAALTAAGGADS